MITTMIVHFNHSDRVVHSHPLHPLHPPLYPPIHPLLHPPLHPPLHRPLYPTPYTLPSPLYPTPYTLPYPLHPIPSPTPYTFPYTLPYPLYTLPYTLHLHLHPPLPQATVGLIMSSIIKHGSNIVRLYFIACAMLVTTGLSVLLFGLHLNAYFCMSFVIVTVALYLNQKV